MPYKDCWVIVHKRRSGTQEQILRQRASAVLVYEAMLRHMLEACVEPTMLVLYRYEADGERALVTRTLVRRRL